MSDTVLRGTEPIVGGIISESVLQRKWPQRRRVAMGKGAFKLEIEVKSPSALVRVAVVTWKRAWDPGLLRVRNGSVLGVAGGSGGCSQ